MFISVKQIDDATDVKPVFLQNMLQNAVVVMCILA
ncbi:hypothetical protein EVA_22479 [gut metagenome]|uniref:Uncharacterized protein n=1 Tax=gut metagenome TaxID=749906 RepID=J9BP94_9ZZZZ